MNSLTRQQRLDRHVLVTTIWSSLGLVAVALFHQGFGTGGWPFIPAGFSILVVAFLGHIIVNAVYGTTFSAGELALGLVFYAAGLVAFGLATLLWPTFGTRHFLAASLGMLAFGAIAIFYMVTHFGLRRVFDAFNVVSDFRSDRRRQGEGRQ